MGIETKIAKKTIERKFWTHIYRCDKCDKYLGVAVEYDDGWYDAPKEVECVNIEVYDITSHTHLINKQILCGECATKIRNDILAFLKEKMFEDEDKED